jgi:hypothetical protein
MRAAALRLPPLIFQALIKRGKPASVSRILAFLKKFVTNQPVTHK